MKTSDFIDKPFPMGHFNKITCISQASMGPCSK